MNTENIKNELIELMSTLFDEKCFDSDIIEYVDLIDDLGMDSMTFISLIIEIESKFNIEVPDDFLLMDYFKNVNDILKIIENEISRKANETEAVESV